MFLHVFAPKKWHNMTQHDCARLVLGYVCETPFGMWMAGRAVMNGVGLQRRLPCRQCPEPKTAEGQTVKFFIANPKISHLGVDKPVAPRYSTDMSDTGKNINTILQKLQARVETRVVPFSYETKPEACPVCGTEDCHKKSCRLKTKKTVPRDVRLFTRHLRHKYITEIEPLARTSLEQEWREQRDLMLAAERHLTPEESKFFECKI